MANWLPALLHALKLETVDIELLNNIDDILSWENVRSENELYSELFNELGESAIKIRYEEFLDRLIVGDFALGEMFPQNLSDESAKKRYRKLIRIFHPDKGTKSQVWLNYRAEKINKSYQAFVDSDVVSEIYDETSPPEYAGKSNNNNAKLKTNTKKKKINTSFRYRSSVWRDRLGSPKQFQKKVLSALFCFAVVLVCLVYWSNQDVSRGSAFEHSNKFNSSLVEDNIINDQSSGNYIDDVRARRILQEADHFLSDGRDVSVDDLEVEQVLKNDELLTQNHQQLDDFITELEVAALSTSPLLENSTNDSCRDYLDLSSSIVVNDKENSKKLITNQNLYSGPSKGCQLLAVLEPDSEILIFSKSQDDSWVKVISNQGENLIGWIDMSEIESGLTGNSHILINEQEAQPQKKLKGVSKVESKKNIRSSNEVQSTSEPEVIDEIVEQNYQVYQPKVQTSSNSVKPKNFKAATYLMLLEDLKEYYQVGDSQKISDLYISSGRENKIRGAEQIRKYYKKAFKKTTNRKFDYSVESYEEEDESTAMIKGSMDLSLKTIKTGVVDKINAKFTIWVFKLGQNYKIVSFEWERQ